MRDAGRAPGDTEPWTAPLHFFALCGYMVAQPVFAVLTINPTFLVEHRMTAPTVFALTVALLFVPPLIVTSLALLVRRTRPSAARLFESVVIGVLFALAVSTLVPASLRLGVVAEVLVYSASAILASITYARVRTVRRYLTWLSPAPVVLAAIFLLTGGGAAFYRAPAEVGGAIARTPHVVYLLFDELALGALQRPDGSIDSRRFPGFGELAKRSTWYPEATTNQNYTESAVPIALSGRFPEPNHVRPPTGAAHPNNMFTLLSRHYELRARETVSSLCPPRSCTGDPTLNSAIKHVAADTLLLYLHEVLPYTLRKRLPPIPFASRAGFFANPMRTEIRVRKLPAPVRPIAGPVFRWLDDEGFEGYAEEAAALERMASSISDRRRPTLWFHHALLPHEPWRLNDDGTAYIDDTLPGHAPHGRWHSQLDGDEALQRYLVQLQAIDRQVGRLIDRLDALGMWDDTMLVVHSDHGVTFLEHAYYRAVEGPGAPDTLRIPLFIKYPGQSRGEVDPRNAEIVDILPTVADALGTAPRWKIDGTSLRRPAERNQKRVWGFKSSIPISTFTADDLAAPPLRKQIHRLFGDKRPRGDLYAFGPHRRLIGEQPRPARKAPAELEIVEAWRFRDVDHGTRLVPTRVLIRLADRTPWRWIAVAVNGRVAGMGRTRPDETGSRAWVLMWPKQLRDGNNSIEVYGIDAADGLVQLSREN